ncbi:MAG: hypothetical protein OEV36_04480 [Myxococcales bacterium]|nr:hypothetical protein [Myxococcales bacterium]
MALEDGTELARQLVMTQRLPAYALVMSTLLSSPSAGAQDTPSSCLTEHELVVASRRYLACGQELIVRSQDESSVVIERRVAPTVIVGLFERDGEVFVELHEVVLRPASSLDLVSGIIAPGAPGSLGTAPAPQRLRRSGEIVAVEPSSFLVTLGSQDGVDVGHRIAVLEEAEQEVAGQLVRTERILVVGEVFEVAPEHARVRLGVDETVELGAKVVQTDAKPARLINRPRVSGLSLAVSLQPFLPINDELAFATLGDAHLTYRFKKPAYVRAVVGAFGGLVSGQGNQSVFDGWVDGGFDHQYFEIGLGVGALRTEGDGQGQGVQARFLPTIAQTVRFGPLDGLHFSASTRAAIENKEVKFGAITTSFWAPVHRRATLVFAGGGGSPALYAFVTAGARFLARGNGGSGTLFVTPAVGWAMIKRFENQGSYVNENNVGGPSLSVAVEWRP